MDEVIRRFNAQGIRYLLIGGQAVRLEGCSCLVPTFAYFMGIVIFEVL